ncbi:MAG: hypothetical protein ABIK31_02595 [candidate division WOR-3 bacterium]
MNLSFKNVVIIGFTTICLILGCSKSALITNDLIAPNWQDGEALSYHIIRNDTIIGYAQYKIFFDMDHNIPVYILQLVTKTSSQMPYFYDTSVVCFRRHDFSPIWAWRKVESDIGYTIVTTRYEGNQAEIWRETIDGTQSFEQKLKQPSFDNEMVLTLLRALRFNKSRKYKLNVLAPMTMENISNTVRKLGKATVITKSGNFECDRIQLRYDNRLYNIFYERMEPRRLIKYQEKNSAIILELAQN